MMNVYLNQYNLVSQNIQHPQDCKDLEDSFNLFKFLLFTGRRFTSLESSDIDSSTLMLFRQLTIIRGSP